MTINEIYECFLNTTGVCTDTRKIIKDCIFFALKGDNFDANTFAENALKLGAKYVVVDNENYKINHQTILVENVLKTLQNLSTHHRTKLNIPIIALTGSNGKTTTKELINATLSTKYKTCATIGNLNNHIGLPLTLLSFNKETEIGIVEMGANHQKEIEFLCNIALPNFGYITNFGKAHLEGFGGTEGVIKGKSELYNYLNDNNKTAFVNFDDEIQQEKTEKINRITFSQKNKNANVFFSDTNAKPFAKVVFEETIANSNLIGIYNINNICAAITIAKHFNVENLSIKRAIESYKPENNRSQLLNKSGYKIILDAYNANPSSMAVAIENFFDIEDKNKTIILGDMFELGNDSLKEHKEIVNQLKSSKNFDYAFLIGNEFYKHKENLNNIYFFKDFNSFLENINLFKQKEKGNLLIKGSRGMALERIIEYLHL